MVNLPLKKNFAPVASTASSVLNIMNDMKVQQANLSTIIGGLDNINSVFSDDLVKVSDSVTGIMTQTQEITARLDKQQQVLNSVQSKSTPESAALISSLSGEVGNLKSVAAQVSSQATSLSNIVKNGINLGTSSSVVNNALSTSVGGFSNKAQDLVSSLDSHINTLTSVINNSEKTLGGGLISNITAGATNPLSSVQDMMKGTGVSSLTSNLPDFITDVNIDAVKRETEQFFPDISEIIKGSLDDLKSSICDPIAAKVTSLTELKSIAGDLDGALAKATDGLSNLQNPLSQLTDVSSKLGDLSSVVSSNLTSVSSDLVSGFTDQISQISDIAGSMTDLAPQVTGQISSLTSTISDSFDKVGGISPITGAAGGIDSLISIADPAKQLSASVTDMNTLSRNLMVSANSLSQLATGLPDNNPISVLSAKVQSIGQSINDQTLGTPLELASLSEMTELPSLNVGSLAKGIANTGSTLTALPVPDISLNINVDKMAQDLTSQILAINTNLNSIPGS